MAVNANFVTLIIPKKCTNVDVVVFGPNWKLFKMDNDVINSSGYKCPEIFHCY